MAYHLHLLLLLCQDIQKQGKEQQEQELEQEHLFILLYQWVHTVMSCYSLIFKWGVYKDYMICCQNKNIRGILYLSELKLILSLLISLYKYNNTEKRSFNACTMLREWTKCWYRAAVKWFYWTNCCLSWREKDIRYVMTTILSYLHSFYSTFFSYFLCSSPFLSSFLRFILFILPFNHSQYPRSLTDPSQSLLPSVSSSNFRFLSFLRWLKW